MEAIENPRDRIYAFISSVIAFGLILLFLIFFLIKTPNPPYPPTVYTDIEIEFDGGGGESGVEGMENPEIKSTAQSKVITASSLTEDVFASQVEEPNIVVNEKKKKDKKKEKKIEEQKTVAPQTPEASDELKSLMASVKNKLKNSSGSSTNTEGDGKANSGTGPGKGNSEGSGSGPGVGPGKGNGYLLRGRQLLQRPQLLDDSQEEGIVVVEILVNELGQVIDAVPGQRGSTTASAYLYRLARQAAKTAKFSASADGAKEQKGTYTFVFRLN